MKNNIIDINRGKESIVKYEDMTDRDWLEIIDNILVRGIESIEDSGLDIYLESLTDNELIIKFNDLKGTSFIIKRCNE